MQRKNNMARASYIYILLINGKIDIVFTIRKELIYYIKDLKKLKDFQVLRLKDGAAWTYLKGSNKLDITEQIREEIEE